MMNIAYWKGVIIKDSIMTLCEKEIEQLLSGHLKSLGLEKLNIPNEEIYSIRVNRRDRLILTPHKGTLLILDYVENHQYHRCNILKKGGLKAYLTSKSISIDETIDTALVPEDSNPFEIKPNQKKHAALNWLAVERHGERWIQLTTDQEAGLATTLPAIITGPAGAGKSTMALSMLLSEISSQDIPDRPIVYICKSDELVEEMKTRWLAMRPEQDVWDDKIIFLTLAEFLQQYLVESEVHLVDSEDFKTWYTAYSKHHPFTPNSNLQNLELVWEEIQICAGYKDVETYTKHLGVRQSNFSLIQEREYLYQTYLKYIESLKNGNFVATELFTLPEGVEPFSMIIADESQNLSYSEIQTLTKLAEKNNIVYFVGEQQILTSRRSNLPYIRDIFHQQGIKISEVNLSVSHRCPKKVITITNELMKLKRLITGGKSDKSEQILIEAPEDAIEGEVIWATRKDAAAIGLREKAQNINFAVIAPIQFHAEIRELFPNGVVIFTIEQAQGLEFKELLAYNVFSPNICEQLSSVIHSDKTKINRAKSGQADLSHSRELDALITTITRTEKKLIIMQTHGNRHEASIAKHLKQFIAPVSQPIVITSPISISKPHQDIQPSLAEWEKKAAQYLRHHEEQAKQIWVDILHRELHDFEKFKETELSKLKKPVTVCSKPVIPQPKPLLPQKQEIPIELHVSKDELEWLNRLALKFKKNHVKKLDKNDSDFSKLLKSKLLTHYLFDIPLQEHDCLLDIMTTSKTIKFFISSLCELPNQAEQVLAYCNPRRHISGFFKCFVDIPETHEYFLELLEKKPSIAKAITGESLSIRLPSEAKEKENMSALYWLISVNDSEEMMQKLLHANPKILHGITAETLCARLSPKASKRANESILYWLCNISNFSRLLLSSILASNPQIVHGLTAEALCYAFPKGNHLNECQSALFGLAMHDILFLHKIIDDNPNLAQGITAEALCRTLPQSAGENAKISPIYFLSREPEGHILLADLFKLNPKLISEFTAKDLCTAVPLYNLSPLYLLSRTKIGIHILQQLFTRNSLLASEITSSALTLIAKIDKKHTALMNLLSSPEGIEVLQSLFDASKLIQTIPSGGLLAPVPQQQVVLKLLCTFGIDILQRLIDENPKFVEKISGEHLSCIAEEDDEPPLYWLTNSPKGLSLMLKLLEKNPQMAQHISKEALEFSKTKVNSDAIVNRLFKSEEGKEILMNLSRNNESLRTYIEEQRTLQESVEISLSEASLFHHPNSVLDKTKEEPEPTLNLKTI